jgi:hypothetical protein
VVPETEATVDDDAAITSGQRRRSERGAGRSDPKDDTEHPDGSTAGSDDSTDGHADDTYPEAPTGSAGHP